MCRPTDTVTIRSRHHRDRDRGRGCILLTHIRTQQGNSTSAASLIPSSPAAGDTWKTTMRSWVNGGMKTMYLAHDAKNSQKGKSAETKSSRLHPWEHRRRVRKRKLLPVAETFPRRRGAANQDGSKFLFLPTTNWTSAACRQVHSPKIRPQEKSSACREKRPVIPAGIKIPPEPSRSYLGLFVGAAAAGLKLRTVVAGTLTGGGASRFTSKGLASELPARSSRTAATVIL